MGIEGRGYRPVFEQFDETRNQGGNTSGEEHRSQNQKGDSEQTGNQTARRQQAKKQENSPHKTEKVTDNQDQRSDNKQTTSSRKQSKRSSVSESPSQSNTTDIPNTKQNEKPQGKTAHVKQAEQPRNKKIDVFSEYMRQRREVRKERWANKRRQFFGTDQEIDDQTRGIERGNTYEKAGISSDQFKEAVEQLREELKKKRAESREKGKQFNDVEYLRTKLLRSRLKHNDSKEGLLFRQMFRAWDALAFHRYSEEVKSDAVLNLLHVSNGGQPYGLKLSPYDALKTIARLDIMATASGLPPKKLDPKWIITEAHIPHDFEVWEERFSQDRLWGFHGYIGDDDYSQGRISFT